MAKFLTTIDIAAQLRELIIGADKTLYLVSPYLQISKDFQELLISREKNKKETVIIYGKNELTPDQLKFLTSMRYVYLKFYENLHAKCYMNDTKLIITSLNFYEYSMINNKEMGVLYDTTNPDDNEIYSKALEYVKLIEDNSDDKPFDLTGSIGNTNKVPSVEKKTEIPKEQPILKTEIVSLPKTNYNGKYFSSSALSKELGMSKKDIDSKIEKLKWIENKNGELTLTSFGKSKGAEIKKGQYGDYIAYPETIIRELDNDLPF